jgi:hypothetical protein
MTHLSDHDVAQNSSRSDDSSGSHVHPVAETGGEALLRRGALVALVILLCLAAIAIVFASSQAFHRYSLSLGGGFSSVSSAGSPGIT